MARLIKCSSTGAIGSSSEFIKIDGKYFKSQEAYEEYQVKEDQRKIRLNIITKIRELLGYGSYIPGNVGGMIGKKLKECNLEDEEIYKHLLDKEDYIKDTFGEVNHRMDIPRVIAIFTIISTIPQSITFGGCYEIRNLDTNEIYIGESLDMFQRINQHVSDLYSGTHHCRALQEAFNIHKDFAHFKFTPLILYDIKNMYREKEKHKTLYLESAYYLKYLYDKNKLYNTINPYIALKENSITLSNYNIDCKRVLGLLLEDEQNILPKKVKVQIKKDLN